MKVRLVAAELFHADGQTDRHGEANSCFSQFCVRAKKRNPYFMTSRTGIRQQNPYPMQKFLPFGPVSVSYGRAIRSRTACVLAHSLVRAN
jgi:hypothetical protein